MVAAATPYISWLGAAATLAEEAANQARAAAAAFETAFTLTVPPPLIAANRVLLATLVATNFFGQNFPAIAATEAEYAEMWAQDATAMYGYAAASATATQLTPFGEPAQATNQGGLAAQAAAVGQAIATPAGTGVPATATPALGLTPDAVSITSVFTSINQALQQLSAGALASQLNPYNWWIVQQVVALNVANRTALSRATVGLAYFSTGMMSFFGSITQQSTFGPGGATAGAGGAWYPTPQFAGLHLGSVAGGLSSHGGVAANLSSGTKIGGLSVPQVWTGSPAAVEQQAAQAIAVEYATDSQGTGANGLLRGMPMGTGSRRAGSAWPPREYGFKRSVLARPPSAG
jgi:PPE-repeat protein